MRELESAIERAVVLGRSETLLAAAKLNIHPNSLIRLIRTLSSVTPGRSAGC